MLQNDHASLKTPPVPSDCVKKAPAAPSIQADPGIEVLWARHLDEVRAAQRLRYEVFAGEMGARLNTPLPGYDIDFFDDHCEHLLVRDVGSGQVIGTYRLLTPAKAKALGRGYSDGEFDLSSLESLRSRMAEVGRSCVHREHRTGGVIMALWGALGQFMQQNKLESMMGCASIPMRCEGLNDGDLAASIWTQVSQKYLAEPQWRVTPLNPLPLERCNGSLDVEPPALIKGYLRLGCKALGPPAWDVGFNTADLPIMMRLQELHPRYRKHFMGA